MGDAWGVAVCCRVRVFVTGWAVAGFAAAAVLLSAGAAWFSPGLGLIVAGVCVAVLTVLFVVDVGGDG